MNLDMSNALWRSLAFLASDSASKTAAETAPLPSQPHPLAIFLATVGLIILLIWIIRRVRRPQKAWLTNSPGRACNVNPVHFLLVLGVQFVPAIVLYFTHGRQKPPYSELIVAYIIGQAIGLPLALVIAKLCFRRGLRRGLGLSMRHWVFDSGRGVLGYLAVFPVCLGLMLLIGWLLRWLAPDYPQPPHLLLEALSDMGPMWKVLIAFSAIIMAPWFEEVLFRGLLQSMLRRFIGPWPSILIASAIFAMVHAQPQHWPPLFALSVALGYNYERCGRLWPAILIHMLFNGVTIIMYVWP
jgi:membrane protease YdiL (CAAX protease family)